ncbi:MAG: 50S ribosomal protein L18 [bacterium]|nr:50S ribosomal protein L18 [bacterium]
MKGNVEKNKKLERRHKRIRAKISGTKEVPRLSVYKSNKFVYAQLIDDTTGTTLAAASSSAAHGAGALEKAKTTGKAIALKALDKKIKRAVFDRGGFIYTGQVKALADGAREGGLKF